ncbi:septal ring lytic transglycosylase RlpA family protein [Flammeovirgaceae bacterium SG7u.111]|nr:septal ring lytic transglycosylase RlpA family protein [Flammeovirgaceae bacterium SG7u.132]WPO38461.1 septal ring lytic transglycosylase RlpA family protein [Flammeovirgaceae bacterium SG7u.111]
MKKIFLTFLTLAFLIQSNWAQVVVKEIGFTQRGKASYYPDNRKGAETRNGETFNMNHLTGAHQHLAFNSLVKVTNLDNGKQVIVRINDRPYTRERIIDLTLAAAKMIGLAGKLSSDVKIEVVGLDADRKQTWLANQKLGFTIPDSLSYLFAAPKPILPKEQTVTQVDSLETTTNAILPVRSVAEIETYESTIQERQIDVSAVANTLAQKANFKDVGSYTVDGKKISLEGFGVVAKSFPTPEEAIESGKYYKSLQFAHVYIQSGWSSGSREYRVMIGVFHNKSDAVSLQKYLSTNNNSVIIRSHLN